MRKTDWFPVSIKPVRVGVYEVSVPYYASVNTHSYWDGNLFRSCGMSLNDATPNTMHCQEASTYMEDSRSMWRGLAEDPNVQP